MHLCKKTNAFCQQAWSQLAAADDSVTFNGIFYQARTQCYLNSASPNAYTTFAELELATTPNFEGDDVLTWYGGVPVNGPAGSELLLNVGILHAATSPLPDPPETITGFAVWKVIGSDTVVLGYHQFATPIQLTTVGDYVSWQPAFSLKPGD